jgi:hypothetical protein
MPMGYQLQRTIEAYHVPMTPREAIAGTEWLSSVPEATIDRLAEALHRVPSGSTLFEQAETPAFALLIASGSVELLAARSADETLVEFVRAPDLLLPAAVLNHQPYLLRARVLDEARIVMIQAEAFRQAVASDQALCLAVLACQAAQFRRQINNWLWVFRGGRIWPQAAGALGFQPAPSNPVRSSFLEGQNGWKPRWASDSHAIGAGAV